MKQLEADVAVIAAGGSGLAAAVAAAQAGVRVIVFEKASTPGGSANQAEGLFAVESRLQKAMGYTLTKEEAFKILMEYVHWRTNARLARAIINKSADTIDWLEDLGVGFSGIACHNPGYAYTWHTIKPRSDEDVMGDAPGSGTTLIKTLADRLREMGGQILTQTPVSKILKSQGRVVGVLAEDRNGEQVQAKAKAVVVATGGFGDNPEWINKYTGYEYGKNMFSMRIPGVVGDGLRMAWEAGAAKSDMVMHHFGGGVKGELTYDAMIPFMHPNLVVNLQGERFINEEVLLLNLVHMGNALKSQKDACAFVMFDDATKSHYQEVGLDFALFGRPYTKASKNFESDVARAIESTTEPGFGLMVAKSVGEIATKSGINPEAFARTVDEYNKACDTGRDDDFYKHARYLRSFRQPPFYVRKLVPTAFGSLGGIRVNERLEALNEDFEPVPGLYAAGNDANSLHVPDYAFILPGSTMGFAVNSGRIAGESAASYVASVVN